MRQRIAHTIIVATAVLAVLIGVFAFPVVKAQASEPAIAMSMDMSSMGMDDAAAMPCMHGTKMPPCCPGSCHDMPACVTGCFIVSEVAPDPVAASLVHADVVYASGSDAPLTDRSVAPISRPPIS